MDDIVFDVPEFSKAERLDLAYRAWKSDNNTDSIRKLAMRFGVPASTLHDRTKGAISKVEAIQAKQLFSPGEEETLKDWCIQLAKWG